MSLYPESGQSPGCPGMSALCQKRTIAKSRSACLFSPRRRIASGESEKQHQRNEDRRNAENEDEPVHGNQDADCCGEASGLPGCEWAAPPTRVMNCRRLMGLAPKPRLTTSL